MVWPALMVWRVLKTRWPVSAALSAISTVARSRHFADENDLGSLAEGGAQAVGVGVKIRAPVLSG